MNTNLQTYFFFWYPSNLSPGKQKLPHHVAYTHTHACAHMHAHTHMHACTHTHTHTHTHIHTHAPMHVHIDIRTELTKQLRYRCSVDVHVDTNFKSVLNEEMEYKGERPGRKSWQVGNTKNGEHEKVLY